jgi:hypothetical protein
MMKTSLVNWWLLLWTTAPLLLLGIVFQNQANPTTKPASKHKRIPIRKSSIKTIPEDDDKATSEKSGSWTGSTDSSQSSILLENY